MGFIYVFIYLDILCLIVLLGYFLHDEIRALLHQRKSRMTELSYGPVLDVPGPSLDTWSPVNDRMFTAEVNNPKCIMDLWGKIRQRLTRWLEH